MIESVTDLKIQNRILTARVDTLERLFSEFIDRKKDAESILLLNDDWKIDGLAGLTTQEADAEKELPPEEAKAVVTAQEEDKIEFVENSPELPPPPSPDFNGTKMLMRASLPVFVLPKMAAKPVLCWQAVHTSDGSLKISLTNDGDAHIQIINFSLSKQGSAQPWTSQKASDYALIGQSLEWILPASVDFSLPESGSTIQLFAQTDAGDIEADVLVLP
tara:strand:- start:2186 stop:2839 length:654 start_codon:yes stop_codon:yes gene_type:complete